DGSDESFFYNCLSFAVEAGSSNMWFCHRTLAQVKQIQDQSLLHAVRYCNHGLRAYEGDSNNGFFFCPFYLYGYRFFHLINRESFETVDSTQPIMMSNQVRMNVEVCLLFPIHRNGPSR
ncbi:unnamed protein product, partial [Rotaria magnacalcarata]